MPDDTQTDLGPAAQEHIEDTSTEFRWLSLKLPDWTPDSGGEQKTYLRMGGPDVDEENALINRGDTSACDIDPDHFREGDHSAAPAGWMDFTDGSRTSITMGRKTEFILGGDYRLHIAAGTEKVYDAQPLYEKWFYPGLIGGYRTVEKTYVKHTMFQFGDEEDFFGGYRHSTMVGLETEFNLAAKYETGAIANFRHNMGADFEYSDEAEISAEKEIYLEVDPSSTARGMMWRWMKTAATLGFWKAPRSTNTGSEIKMRKDNIEIGMAPNTPGDVTLRANGPGGKIKLDTGGLAGATEIESGGTIKLKAKQIVVDGQLMVNGVNLSVK